MQEVPRLGPAESLMVVYMLSSMQVLEVALEAVLRQLVKHLFVGLVMMTAWAQRLALVQPKLLAADVVEELVDDHWRQ